MKEYEYTYIPVCGERPHMYEYANDLLVPHAATYADATYARSYCYMCVLIQVSRLIQVKKKLG
jgi:hypothetical protein